MIGLAASASPPPAPAPAGAALSALDGWLDVCRTGEFEASTGSVSFDQADFDQMIANHAAADPVPVVLGHPEMDAPALGWVERLRRVGDRLQARLTRLDPDFRAAVEAGRYAPRSIAVERPEGGTWHLRHLGFLGATAPAVDGLSPTFFGATDGWQTVRLAAPTPEERLGWRVVARALRAMREWIIERSSVEAADRALPQWNLDDLRGLGEPTEDDMTALAADLAAAFETYGGAPMPAEPKPDASATLEAERAQLAAERAALGRERQAIEAERVLAARRALAEATVTPHVEAGRVTPAERGTLVQLLAALPAEGETIRLAGGDGKGGERKLTPAAALDGFLAGLPVRVEYSELAGGRPPPAAGDGPSDAEIARKAAKLAADTGMGVIEAVDRVRAELGASG